MRKQKQLKRFIQIDTVDGFQGAQKQIIIISTVRAPGQKNAGVGFLKDYRRMNVAITRAKYFLFIVGNEDALNQDLNWRQLIQHMKDRKAASSIKASNLNYFSSDTIQDIVPYGHNNEILQKKYVEVQQDNIQEQQQFTEQQKQQEHTICFNQSNQDNQQRVNNIMSPKQGQNQQQWKEEKVDSERQQGQIFEILQSDQDEGVVRNERQKIKNNGLSSQFPFILDIESNEENDESQRVKKRDNKSSLKSQKRADLLKKRQNIVFNK